MLTSRSSSRLLKQDLFGPPFYFTLNRILRKKFFFGLLLATLLTVFASLRVSPITHNARALRPDSKGADSRKNLEGLSASNNQQCPMCPPETEQTIYSPLFDLPEADGSEINLNCRSSHSMDVAPTFYLPDGAPVIGEVIHLQPAEIRFVNTKSLIPREYRRQQRWAGMSLSYTGHYMEVWAQLTLHGINGGGSVNVFFSVLNDRRSNTLASVWWMPPDGTAVLALGNGSAQSIHATLSFSGEDSQDIDIAPFATEVVRRRGNQRGGHSVSRGVADSAIISSTGVPGSLIATGIVASENGRFTGSARFYDIVNAAQPNLFATRFKMENVIPHLLLRNTTSSIINAQPRFRPMAGESGDPVELPVVTLGPNEATELNLDPLRAAVVGRSDLKEVSVQIVNDGGPGSLVGALYGTDLITGAVYDVPLRDSGGLRVSTGGYPIRLDGDYSTIISITNVTDRQSEFTAYINYEGGRYVFPVRRLGIGETAVFDVREIRDRRIPDGKRQTLPESFTVGQFRWSIHGGGVGARLLGRSEIISRAAHVNSSYSCTGCCPSSFAWAGMNPFSVLVLVNGFAPITAQETDGDCYGNFITFSAGGAEWSCSNTSIATVEYATGGENQVEGLAPGAVTVSAWWPYEAYIYDGQDCRDYGPSTASTSCNVQVGSLTWTTPHSLNGQDGIVPLSSGSPPQGSPAFVNSTTITATGSPSGGTYSWSTSSNKVSLTNTTSATVTVTGSIESQNTRDVTIMVTYTYNEASASQQVPFTVQKPTSMAYVSTDSSGTRKDCPSGQTGPYKRITWQLRDRNNNPIRYAIPTYDTVTNNTPNSCLLPATGEGTPPGLTTDGDGKWGPHFYGLCSTACINGGSCSATGTQKYFANGYEIDLSFSMSCTSVTVAGH
jgi:hypothetical protein